MILKLFPFQNEVMLSEEYVTIFQINNKSLFNKVANSFYDLSTGQLGEENIVLLEDGKLIDFEEKVLFLSDLWHFDCTSKNITNKLLNYIENNYKLDVELMEEIQKQLQLIRLGIRELTDELPFEVEMKEMITVQDLLKMLGVKLAKLDGYSLLERALSIIEIVEQFKLYPVIILCNIKNYFNEEDLLELYKQAIHCKIKLMIFEFGIPEKLIEYERMWYIDEDYEEFIKKPL